MSNIKIKLKIKINRCNSFIKKSVLKFSSAFISGSTSVVPVQQIAIMIILIPGQFLKFFLLGMNGMVYRIVARIKNTE